MKKVRKSRFLQTILLLITILSLSLPAYAKYGGGSGYMNDPYLIYTAEQMNAIGVNKGDWDKYFKLMADIDLSTLAGTNFNVIGNEYDNPFTGVFDGNGHTISKLTIRGKAFRALFGRLLVGAMVKDLGLIDVNVTGSMRYVAGLVGLNGGDITNCYSTGIVNGMWAVGGLVAHNNGNVTHSYSSCVVNGEEEVGGLIGYSGRGRVSCCYSSGTVNGFIVVGGLAGFNWLATVTQCYSTGVVNGERSVGGLVGDNYKGDVTDCYSSCEVTGNEVVGGLAGRNKETIRNCYATGSVAGTTDIGGLVGQNDTEGDVLVSFWDIQTSGQTTSAGGTGKSTAELLMSLTFFSWGGWDNEGNNIWTINEGNDYPRLWWENIPGHVIEPTAQLLTHATNPNPIDGTLINDTWVSLTWEPGDFAVSHEVYFGDNFDDVNIGAQSTFQGKHSETYFTVGLPGSLYPNGLVPGKTYYWRIDEVDDKQTYGIRQRGDVWSFKVASLTAYNPNPPDGSMHDDEWVSLEWSTGDYAVSHDVYFGDNFDDVNIGAQSTFQSNQTNSFFVLGFSGFPYPDGLVPGSTYYWRIDEVNDNEPNSPWKGDIWSFSISPRTAYNPDPVDYSESVDLNVKLSWTPGFGAKLHTVYFGDNYDDVNDATGGEPIGFTTYNPGTLKMAKTYYWRVDELDSVDIHKGDVWSFFTRGTVGNPNPSNGAVDVKPSTILTWTPGIYADSHHIYFGYDEKTVKNADSDSPEYKGSGDFGYESYDPGKLELNTSYYWRIDEVNIVNPDSPWKGPVWSFTTADFIVVDDFESYNDLDIYDPASRRIYVIWVDGFNDPTNGSIIGMSFPWWPKVHSGNQSMPFSYDNSVGKSEATANIADLEISQDWTIEGVIVLSLWFSGGSANASEPMYVALANANGTTGVVYHDNPNAAQLTAWMEWRIDLQEFADQGVDLTNVNSITIGFGNISNPVAGGSGRMYFDDIRLYRSEP